MPLISNSAAVILLLMAHCGSWTRANRLGSFKVCPSCRAGRRPRDYNLTPLPIVDRGEKCGVNVAYCAKGLRCNPPPGETFEFAVAIGAGVCGEDTSANPSRMSRPRDPRPPDSLEDGPCKKELDTITRDFVGRVIPLATDIYLPDCDDRGFYNKFQCRAYYGLDGGNCWCVNELGENVNAVPNEDGKLPCWKDYVF